MTVRHQRHAESLAEGSTYTSGRIISQMKMPQTLSRASTSGGRQIPNKGADEADVHDHGLGPSKSRESVMRHILPLTPSAWLAT